jgi:RNA recognition motif-containing protein
MLSRDQDSLQNHGPTFPTNRKTPDPSTHNYLLVKNLPPETTEDNVRGLFRGFQSLREVLIVKNSNNIYVTFDSTIEVQRILKLSESKGFEVAGRQLKMCLVSKLPLDLNDKSSIVLMTIYNERIEISVDSIYDLFREFGVIRKIIIFKKKNYQVFIEFGSSDDALFFKEALHNTNYRGLVFLKIQFTQKKELVVNGDSQYERDFTTHPHSSQHFETRVVFGEQLHSITPTPSINKYLSRGEKFSMTELSRTQKADFYEQGSTKILTHKSDFSSVQSGLQNRDRILSSESYVRPSQKNPEADVYSHLYIRPENVVTSLKNLDFVSANNHPSNTQILTGKGVTGELDHASSERLFLVRITNLSLEIKHKPIFNLFSLYGNIDNIMLDSSTNSAIVAFDSDTARQTACSLLNGTLFFGRIISTIPIKDPSLTEPVTKSNY